MYMYNHIIIIIMIYFVVIISDWYFSTFWWFYYVGEIWLAIQATATAGALLAREPR